MSLPSRTVPSGTPSRAGTVGAGPEGLVSRGVGPGDAGIRRVVLPQGTVRVHPSLVRRKEFRSGPGPLLTGLLRAPARAPDAHARCRCDSWTVRTAASSVAAGIAPPSPTAVSGQRIRSPIRWNEGGEMNHLVQKQNRPRATALLMALAWVLVVVGALVAQALVPSWSATARSLAVTVVLAV